MAAFSPLKTAFDQIRKRAASLTTGTAKVDISFDTESRLKLIEKPSKEEDIEQDRQFIPVYSNGSDVEGHIEIHIPNGIPSLDYAEISVYLVGHVVAAQLDHDEVFLSHKLTIKSMPGTLTESTSFDYKFKAPDMELDSYYGHLFQCRYFIRALVHRTGKMFGSNIKTDHDFCVMNLQKVVQKQPVTMQVGVDDCLHIRFDYNNVNIPMEGCLEGKVTVLQNNLKITSMQIQLIRREMIRTAEIHRPEVLNTVILGKYEIMDGLPGDEEVIPIRMFFQRFKDVTNTQIHANHSVRYYANLGLIDADGRRYFKTCEVHLFRTKIQ